MSERPNEIHMLREKTNFDLYLEEQLKDPAFGEWFEKANEAWDAALQAASEN